MFSLARANIGHQWKLFLAAISVLVLSGCLIYTAIGISLSNVRSVTSYDRSLDIDLYIESSKSLPGGRRGSFPVSMLYFIEQFDEVERAEAHIKKRSSYNFKSGSEFGRLMINVMETDIKTLGYPKQLHTEAREALSFPETIFVASSLSSKYGWEVGDTIELTLPVGSLKVAGIVKGELGRQALIGGSLGNFVTTQTDNIVTGRQQSPNMLEDIAFIRIKLKSVQNFDLSRQKLDYYLKPYQLKTLLPQDYQNRITFDFIFENKALQGFLFVGALAVIIPLFIVVQTLRSAIMAQNVQFATMRALGVPSRHLISVAMEQALWVGVLGAALSYCGMLIIKWQLFERDIFMYLPLNVVGNVSAAIIGAALLAGLISLFAIFKTQPQELLR